jgi:uncharacterized Ntn-hydrolase superfamily protein
MFFAQPARTTVLIIGTLVASLHCGSPRGPEPRARLSPASYSILGRDPLTGEYGVAAASHAPLIGMNLDFFDPEAGAVVVLGGPHLALNEKVLIALRDGLAPGRAIAVGLYDYKAKEERQVLAISQQGAAAFTGKKLKKFAGDRTGDYFVAAGNQVSGEEVLEAMEEAFLGFDGPLTDRLLLALQAGRDAGGEQDGTHSAALLVVGPNARFASRDRLVDLRIDFVSGDAVEALTRLHAQVDSVYGVVR